MRTAAGSERGEQSEPEADALGEALGAAGAAGEAEPSVGERKALAPQGVGEPAALPEGEAQTGVALAQALSLGEAVGVGEALRERETRRASARRARCRWPRRARRRARTTAKR